jgi:outer membrane biosynthesis protein TonB
MQNLDWVLVAVVAASFIMHFGFVIYLRNIDWPRKPDIEEIPDRFVQMIVPKKIEEPKPVVAQEEKKDEKKEAKKDKGDAAKKAPPKPRDPAAEARAAAERRARLAADVQKMGVLKILGAKGENGSVADLVKGGDVSGDADKVFAQVGGVGVATTGGGVRSKGAGGTGSLRGGGSLRASGPGEVGTGEKGGERAVKGIVKDSAPTDVDGSLDPSVIVREIRGRIRAVTTCYEQGLKRNPNIGGKLQLRFEVSTVGKVTSAEIENDSMHDEEVASCIKSRVMTWRFPAPAGGRVQFSYPFIFQASK